MPNWTEEATEKMDAIDASLPPHFNLAQRQKAIISQCPYHDPIKVKCWKTLAKSRFSAERVRKPICKHRSDEEQAAWIARNLR